MPSSDTIRIVHDRRSGIEAIHARFAGHAYDLHRHDEWLVGVTNHGVQDFFCRGTRQRSTPGRVILIEPGEMHDGQAGAPGGFAYSMLYLPIAWMRANDPGRDPAIRATLSDDEALGRAIRRACRVLGGPAGCLARDEALDAVLHRLRPHLGRPAWSNERWPGAVVARRARDRLHEHFSEDIGADELARATGAANRFQLARAFRAAFGTSPHAYLVQIRLTQARRLLTAGEPPAAVAANCGFADQSHFGRWFRRAYGITPAAYRACCTGIPDNERGRA